MIKRSFRKFITCFYWRFKFHSLGKKSILYKPILVTNPKNIDIGHGTSIRDGARLEVINRPEFGWKAKLSIGNNVNIEQGVHIICQGNVVIEDNVSITPYCVIVDTYHPHHHPSESKIGDRLPEEKTFVKIGKGTFIGTHSIIMPNVSVGSYCVIGAGSVVTKCIPDYSIAMGSPARVTGSYDSENKVWVNTSRNELIK